MLNDAPGNAAAGEEPTDAPPATTPARRTRRRATASTETTSGSSESTAEHAPATELAAGESATTAAAPTRRRRRSAATQDSATPAAATPVDPPADAEPKPTRSRRRAAAAPAASPAAEPVAETPATQDEAADGEPTTGRSTTRRSRRTVTTTAVVFMAPPEPERDEPAAEPVVDQPPPRTTRARGQKRAAAAEPVSQPAQVESAEPVVEPAEGETARPSRRRRGRRVEATAPEPVVEPPAEESDEESDEDEFDSAGRRRRRRGRRGRGRGKGTFDGADEDSSDEEEAADEEPAEDEDEPLTRRRRRRRRRGAGEVEPVADDGVVTVVKIREPRPSRDEVQGVSGSTRLEAKRQRRRDGREQRRTRPPILSESEFLARREAVDRVMVVRQSGDRTQVAVLEDGILVEHYVTRQTSSSIVGNVYLGKVQNVLPSMEAAFVDIGRGRNAVLYAGEVNWDSTGLEGRARSIEHALRSGESVLVQVTKDPIGHKGARLTSHIALSGRHLVYVPNGHASGISRKLSDVERRRLRDVLKNLVPDGAGVIVRTAAEGASEDELARDVTRLQAQWDEIRSKVSSGGAPVLLSAEPDLLIRVVRDLFNEDFREVVIEGADAYEQVEGYLSYVSPDLVGRIRRHAGTADVFAQWRIDEQILKGLDRKVYLPSGGHLVIDRTEAMTVVDVNTGKYTGAGGNLEETVTRNNLEAAEEIVRQLRLRDIGGIVVIDFIDMVLESNRELVLRRLTECLGRDRTKHQVTEITSLGLVQMTRKRIGQGLVEAFSEACDHCKGRGLIIHTEPVSDRPRNIVAEKVRAVAASTRDGSDADNEPEASLSGSEEVDSAVDELAAVVDDLQPEPGLADDGESGDREAESDETDGSVRRRTRRGSSRRRTRP